jgi:hypothetical protein
MRASLQRCPVNRLIGPDAEKVIDRAAKMWAQFSDFGLGRVLRSFSGKRIKCTKSESMNGVSTRFLTMDALEADSQALEASRQTGQGREARK